MSNAANALVSALEELLSAVRELLTLSYDKRRAITRGDTDRLGEITAVETRLVTALNAAERRRYAAAAEVNAEVDAQAASPGDSSAEDGSEPELARLKQELTVSMRLLLDMNERSRLLLEQRLNYTSDCIDALTLPEIQPGDIYTGDGRLYDNLQRGYYIGDA
ncbi:MAG: flagellar protein FlgN [Oscillospiraceae bacterium]|jgi:flagellar biosynthesis/type III secretory pathway chaperone|nr:flagellar protein FlgN [Oscillospiraceae bacterium]